MTCGLTFKNSFIPSAVSLYNSWDINNRSFGTLQKHFITIKNPLYYHGKSSNNNKHSQLRMHCSEMNHHLFTHHVLDSPRWLCGYKCDNSEHFLLYCALYYEERRVMLSEIQNI